MLIFVAGHSPIYGKQILDECQRQCDGRVVADGSQPK
jgi:hypothetical protein